MQLQSPSTSDIKIIVTNVPDTTVCITTRKQTPSKSSEEKSLDLDDLDHGNEEKESPH